MHRVILLSLAKKYIDPGEGLLSRPHRFNWWDSRQNWSMGSEIDMKSFHFRSKVFCYICVVVKFRLYFVRTGEEKLELFENRVLTQRDRCAAKFERGLLLNEEFRDFYSSPC